MGRKLKTETDTPAMKSRIEAAFAATNNDHHENPDVVFEHGQHYVHCTACGAIWSVVDAVGGSSIDGFDFEITESGDESCNQMNSEEEHSQDDGEYNDGEDHNDSEG